MLILGAALLMGGGFVRGSGGLQLHFHFALKFLDDLFYEFAFVHGFTIRGSDSEF
jgi:hypothetical protein